MDMSWIEVWSLGQGRNRTYCGIAAGTGEFAVDVFSGDTCVSSDVYLSQAEALNRANALLRRYQTPTAAKRRRALAYEGYTSVMENGTTAVSVPGS